MQLYLLNPFKSITDILVCLVIVLAWNISSVFSAGVKFIPVVYISEGYTDNYEVTQTDRQEEWYTSYGIGLFLVMQEKNGRVVLNYTPEFIDYDVHDEQDTWQHNASFFGDWQHSRKFRTDFRFNYDGHGDNNEKETWEHGAYLGSEYDFTKYTNFFISGQFFNTFDRQTRTGDWQESEELTATSGLKNEFAKDSVIEIEYTFSTVDYEKDNIDDYKEHSPSVNLSYALGSRYGIDLNLLYEERKYDVSDDDSQTYTGEFRLIRKFSPRFQIYGKYEHSYTKEESGDNTVYYPSMGFDWDVSEDSGVSMGVGYMIRKWENEDDQEGLFVDADVFKTFDITRRCALTLSGSSGYDATSDDAASLGFQIYYQAGFLLSYQALRTLSTLLKASYVRDEYDEPDVDRTDDTVNAAAGMLWGPFSWMQVSLLYEYEDYKTDAPERESYYENRGTVTVILYPRKPPEYGKADSRENIENRIYH